MPEVPNRLQPALIRERRTFKFVEPPGPDCAHIHFTGRFSGEDILWDATVITLAYYYREYAVASGDVNTVSGIRQFIEVGARDKRSYRLLVALNVPKIDEPTLLKTIIMIRKYKRLHVGRHSFGPPWSP